MSRDEELGGAGRRVRRSETTARGTVLMSGAHALVFSSNAVAFVVAGRVLSTEDYGRFAVAFLMLA